VKSRKPDVGSDRALVDKLGVKPGMQVALFDYDDPIFSSQVVERGAAIVEPGARGLDLAFLMVRSPADLDRLGGIRSRIQSDGAIWVLREKGAGRAVREVDVIDAGKSHRLVDNKIASFSESLAAMRLVIPLSLRTR
jgi:hypothetical protein